MDPSIAQAGSVRPPRWELYPCGEYWIDKGDTHESNSGIFIRAQRTPTPWVDGYEIQISLQDPKNPTGSIYGRVPTNLERMREIAPEKQWNRFEIRACGAVYYRAH